MEKTQGGLLFILLLLFGLSFFTASCVMDNTPGDQPPETIAMLVTVQNNTGAPARVKMRHARYDVLLSEEDSWNADAGFSYAGARWVYTDWIGLVTIEADKSRALDSEEYRGLKGFILWAQRGEEKQGKWIGNSSFEMEIETGNITIRLAGHETEATGFDGTELGCLKIKSDTMPVGRSSRLHYRDKNVWIAIPFVVRAALTIKNDGSWSFEYADDVPFGDIIR
jgi:hypothetical protein